MFVETLQVDRLVFVFEEERLSKACYIFVERVILYNDVRIFLVNNLKAFLELVESTLSLAFAVETFALNFPIDNVVMVFTEDNTITDKADVDVVFLSTKAAVVEDVFNPIRRYVFLVYWCWDKSLAILESV